MPNRIIKESICASDTIDQLNWFEEVFFYRLMVNVDDYGRFDARTAIIKARLFPLKSSVTEKIIEQTLNRLDETGIIHVYTVGGKPYLQLPSWEKHQTIRNHKSKYPSADESDLNSIEINCNQLQADDSKCSRNPIQSISESNPNPSKVAAATAPSRAKHGKFGWVKLTEDEYTKLCTDLGDTELKRCIAYIDESAQSNGNKNKWKDWNLVIRKCSRDKWGLNGSNIKKVAFQNYGENEPVTAVVGIDLLAEARGS